MKFGISLPTCGEGRTLPERFATPRDIIRLAQMAEGLGFDTVWGDDHITVSESMTKRYRSPLAPPNYFEILITLACAAEATQRIQLGAGVVQVILRDPVLLAKQAATLDALSGGRFILGLGLGSHRDEFENLNPRLGKAHRGHMLDEGMEALNLLLTQDKVSYKGKYYEFQDVAINPKPVQRPLPIYISGKNPETYKRVAKWGSGYFLSHPTLEDINQRLEDLRVALEDVGRDFSEIDVCFNGSLSIAKTHKEAAERFMNSRIADRSRGKPEDRIIAESVIGTPAELIERIGQLKAAGLTSCNLSPYAARDFGEMVEQVQMFGEEVLPAFRSG